jgi:uncharacterized membrane protein
MKSRAAIAGHPLHPILVTLPIGLWVFSLVCDIVYHAGWGDDSWKKAALYCLAGGLVFAFPAILTGLIDYGIVRDPKARTVATFHLILNLLVLPFMAVSVGLRWEELGKTYYLLPVIISGTGVVLLGVSGWLGGELVSRFHISVHEETPRS